LSAIFDYQEGGFQGQGAAILVSVLPYHAAVSFCRGFSTKFGGRSDTFPVPFCSLFLLTILPVGLL